MVFTKEKVNKMSLDEQMTDPYVGEEFGEHSEEEYSEYMNNYLSSRFLNLSQQQIDEIKARGIATRSMVSNWSDKEFFEYLDTKEIKSMPRENIDYEPDYYDEVEAFMEVESEIKAVCDMSFATFDYDSMKEENLIDFVTYYSENNW
jgi:hypothetical protein